MFTLHRNTLVVIIALSLFASASVRAADNVRISALPLPQSPSTETALFFEPPLWNDTQSEFFITLSLDATASNNVELALWDDATDTLETAAVIGWDCGEIFIYDGFTRAIADFTPEAQRITILFRTRLTAQSEPFETAITANGIPLEFYDSEGEPAFFTYSPDWNAAHAVSRGLDQNNEQVNLWFRRDPSVITVR